MHFRTQNWLFLVLNLNSAYFGRSVCVLAKFGPLKTQDRIEFAILMLQLIGTLSAIAVLAATVNSDPSANAISANPSKCEHCRIVKFHFKCYELFPALHSLSLQIARPRRL